MSVDIKPLAGLVVVDIGTGMPPALIAKFLRENGAAVTRAFVENTAIAADYYPAYDAWTHGESTSSSPLSELLASADVCLLGGEDYPGLKRPAKAADLAREFPRLVVLDISGYPESGPDAGRPAVDILVQARLGLVFEHFADRPVMMGFKPTLYGAALHGISGILAALIERERSGKGQVVTTSLFEGGLAYVEGLWAHTEKPTPVSEFNVPKGALPLLFQCADDQYIQIMLGTAGGKSLLYETVGLDSSHIDKRESGMLHGSVDPKLFFGPRDLLEPAIRKWRCADLVAALKAKGLAAEPVLQPGECWKDAQVEHNRLISALPDGRRMVGNPIQVTNTAPAVPKKFDESPGPLDGVRIADFGMFLAGPYISVFLRDLGADVIKIEPNSGDPGRQLHRMYSSANRGKHVIALDMKHPEGRKVAAQLSEVSDVVISNFRTGVSARLGLDGDTLLKKRQDQVVLENPGFGLTGPKAGDAGLDMVMQALCGHQYRAGGRGNSPAWSRTTAVDYSAGQLGTIAVLLGLLHLQRNGQGIALSVPLLNVGVFLLSELVQLPDGKFAGAPPLNAQMTGIHPAEALYEARDGWIAIAARGADSAKRLVKALGLESELDQPRETWGAHEELLIAAAVRKWSVIEALENLSQAKVWGEPCLHAFENGLFSERYLAESGIIQSNQHESFGRVTEFGTFVHFSRSICSGKGGAPKQGQHTRDILAMLGYDAKSVEELYASGAVS